MTVEEALKAGYMVKDSQFITSNTESEVYREDRLEGPGYPLRARDGIITGYIFDARNGIAPPEEVFGLKIDPQWSASEIIDALLYAGYECRQESPPVQVNVHDQQHVESRPYAIWRMYAWKKSIPEAALEFEFRTPYLWSWTRQGVLENALAIEPAVFLKQTTLAKVYRKTMSDRYETAPGSPEQLEFRKKAALCLGAPLALQNAANYDMLALFKQGKSKVEPDIWKSLLSSSWSIDSREKFLETFADVAENGHTASWTEMEKIMDANPGLDPLRIALYMNYSAYQCDRLFLVRAARGWLGSRSIKAWDLGRLINVTRWAYAAGYISETEAWERILGMADELFALYGSWDDYFAAYATGRGFFGADEAWDYMETVIEYVSVELGKADAQLSQEPDLWTGKGEAARTERMQYAVSAEQQSAREFIGRINELFEEAAAVKETLDFEAGLAATALLREMLASQGIGDSLPPLYYGARLLEGGILYESGAREGAREAALEVLSYAPGNETALELLDLCTPDSER